MKTFFNGTWYTIERNQQGGVDMTRDISLVDLLFSISMLGMGAMPLSFAVDCESASVGVDMERNFSIVDLLFSIAMLGMGAMLLSFAVDCESASVGTKAFSIISGGILMVISMLSLD